MFFRYKNREKTRDAIAKIIKIMYSVGYDKDAIIDVLAEALTIAKWQG